MAMSQEGMKTKHKTQEPKHYQRKQITIPMKHRPENLTEEETKRGLLNSTV